ncbi:hypothetical protein L4174_005535 [Photobacterium sp. CCB-ST2H9]|uniref:hypothetical protein n=1 Tax=Photobacterium sp. CCB-ST2H9 TaxID=2912855 RepID=UPI00200466E4|nr:hypothetical protein [Photobacterium sp. CCB-ST2H9]UTM58304.1 hypothetical protein L4174_005535 [Photobacterium sp. CCB-ST2H9]
MKKMIFLFLLLFTPGMALANAMSAQGYITQLYVKPGSNFVRVTFSQPIVNTENCEKSGSYIAELDDSKSSDRFYSALLAAHMAQKKVSFWIAGCTSGEYWGGKHPKIYDIYIY